MTSTLYDPAVFLTNEEYREKYPEIPLVDIQSAVENPYLYILGQSTSSDFHTFTSTRLDDLRSLQSPTNHNGIEIYDNLRVFSGDGFGRQAFCCKISEICQPEVCKEENQFRHP